MQFDRQLTIAVGGTRFAEVWPNRQIFWSEILNKLNSPVRSPETLTAYLRMPKRKQDALKDVGGFVGGGLQNGKRSNGSVLGRDIVTLDMDAVPAGGTEALIKKISTFGVAYSVYSTRKHDPAKPRLRVLFPLDRTVTADEYEPIARKMAELIGIDYCDPTTFQAVRMMYWPSVSQDGEYVFTFEDKPFASADSILRAYTDWRDVKSWPRLTGHEETYISQKCKQEDPQLKSGIVGAFCNIYNVVQAIDTFLPDEYEACNDGRYTYIKGSTTGGAVTYQDDTFLYSHHATDPAGGKLVNAFDLVRLHKFAHLDAEAKASTPINRMPSFVAMRQFALNDEAVKAYINNERYAQAAADFGDGEPAETDADWMNALKINQNTGLAERTSLNVRLMLENDPRLKGRLRYDEFADRIIGTAPLPWGNRKYQDSDFIWEDSDEAGLRLYAESVLCYRTKELIDDAMRDYLACRKFNPVTEYLKGLKWDGVHRLDTLFIDYLGADDTPYVKGITRKAFVAAVTRAMRPGAKFDNMTILSGPQGIGKSTLLTKMARGWFNDSIRSFEGKDASELLQGVWIVEISELGAFAKSDVARIKQFLSQKSDIYRPAFGKNVVWHDRQCVFFGTSNNQEYLQDGSGNRRFWPIDTGVQPAKRSVFTDLDAEVDQLWAEAYVRWQLGESLYLTGALDTDAKAAQEAHREVSAQEGLILDYISGKVPKEWEDWDLQRRLMWLANPKEGDFELVERDRICALEVWCEALRGDARSIKYNDAKLINTVIASQSEWQPVTAQRFKYAGRQRGFKKRQSTLLSTLSTFKGQC